MFRAIRGLLLLSFRQHPRKMAIAIALMAGNAVAVPAGALALKHLTNEAIAGHADRAATAGIIVAACAMAALTCAHFAHIAYFEVSEINVLTMDQRLIAVSNGSPYLDHHERPEHADRMALVQEELQRLGEGLQALLTGASLAVGLLITTVLLTLAHPALIALPLLAVLPLLAGRKAQAAAEQARERSATDTRQARHLFELTTAAASAKELRLLGLTGELQQRYARHWQRSSTRIWRGELAAGLWRAGGQTVFAFGYVGALILVVGEAVRGRAGIGDVVLAIVLAAQLNQQVAAAVTIAQQLLRSGRSLQRFDEVRQTVTNLVGSDHTMPPPDRLTDGIRLEHVSFAYPGTDVPVLRGIDLLLPAGSTVAIVGENGAGKTTLVKLLGRLYEASSGRILVDGTDLRRLDLTAWRQRMSAGFQDFARFELTARTAVGIGDLPRVADDRAVQTALARARSGVVTALPSGLDTRLGRSHAEGGTDVSGGQWQQLALARAMMRDEPLLMILDEPASALDAEAEHRLFAQYAETASRVAKETGGITVFVSHRFSTVRMADLIIVIAGGTVQECGTHETLMALAGTYADLYNIQAAAYRP
ncbi:ATP-binding cassette subfamily B protein [Allocatelliglobosispora scoriae]|uniref:ATP-binding cassette subfamily B protein n=1 Tax=Allocatelliglobosispora scoriae TaxID=643052 RepID=A0A841BL97_9ACTN|nr:ABC transporter ATP-binding protein [Allocatelliglobosispora scoriae]MBB5867590.1 ATP-binding cassette subfamily B protein [Allocatelliglobosispora scoriae]